MSITASQVKELRERTGAGMMECKQALTAAEGDMEKAIDIMRKAGQAKAAKKSSRVAADGIIVIKTEVNNKTAFIVEINSETDFAARNEEFLAFATKVAERGLSARMDDASSLLDLTLEANGTVSIAESCEALIAKIGENIRIRRAALITSEQPIATYCHNNRIGVVVELSKDDLDLGKDIAMHIAASRPEVIYPEDVKASVLDKEKEIYLAQVAQTGKPEAILEKMIAGKIQKFINEISLVGQPFVKDPNITIAELLKKHGAKVLSFVRFEVGEGIEKEVKDFAAEVMAQVNKG